jgi:ribosome-associated translation inhibitor RaiA
MLPLQVHFRGLDRSEAIEESVRLRTEKLARLFDRIMECRVTIDAPPPHHHKGGEFNVHIELPVPGKTITVSHTIDAAHGATGLGGALHRSFETAERLIRAHAERLKKKHHDKPQSREPLMVVR